MIPPHYGSILFQNSSLNRTPRENFYILSYIGPNEIYEYFPKIEWNLLSIFLVSDLEDEPVTHENPYNFVVLNSPITGHLGKRIINPKW